MRFSLIITWMTENYISEPNQIHTNINLIYVNINYFGVTKILVHISAYYFNVCSYKY